MNEQSPQPQQQPEQQLEQSQHLQAVQGLFVRNYGKIRAFVGSLVRDPVATEDIVHNVFLVVTKKADSFKLGTNFTAWVFSISRFEVLRHFDKSKKQPRWLSEELLDMLVSEAPEVLGDSSRQVALRRCIEKLSPRSKQLIQHRYMDGMKTGAIAKSINWTPQAVSVTLSRARVALRECVEKQIHREGWA